MTTKQYKDLTGKSLDEVHLASFTGYEIKREYSKPSFITEYLDGEVLGTISFRPTKLPVIFSVKYGNYREERYNHGGISSRYVVNKDGKLSGEYTRYTSAGVLTEVRYFNDSKEVTADIKSFVNFSGSNEEFMQYEFGEDEHFNIYMQYGAYFKFLDEYDYVPKRFDDIVACCLQ